MIIFSWCVLVIVLIFGCYLPAFTIFHDRSRPVSLAHVWMYTAVGLGSLGTLTLVAKAAGADMRFSLVPGLLLSLYAIFVYKRICLPTLRKPTLEVHAILAYFIGGVYAVHIIVQGFRMGSGSYPAVFTEFDVVYYLGHIHSFIRYDTWPPLSLNNLGGTMATHFGAQASCALLSVVTGLPAHTSFFLVFMPLIAFGMIAVVWLIVKEQIPQKAPGAFIWIGVLLLLYAPFYPLHDIFSILSRAFSNFRALGNLPSLLLDPDTFGFLSDYHLIPSSHFGLFGVTVLLYCLQDFTKSSRQRLAAFIVGILVVFKSPYFLTAGFGFGAWILCEIYRTRQIRLILSPGFALILALSLNMLSESAKAFSLAFKPGLLLMDPELGLRVLGAILITGGLVWLTPKSLRSIKHHRLWYYWWFILPPYFIANIITTRVGGQIFRQDMFQICTVIPTFLAMFVLTVLSVGWERLTRARRQTLVVFILLLYFAPLGHKTLHSILPFSAPEYIREESTDNTTLAEALNIIPLQDSVIVTNETGFPWENSPEDWFQVEYSGIFGHQMYAMNYKYERYYDEHLQEKIELQQGFRNSTWEASLEQRAQKLDWTHLVIYRPSPHARDIPLPLIFENHDYQVYTFNKL